MKHLTKRQLAEAEQLPVDPNEGQYTIKLTFDLGGPDIESDFDKLCAAAWRALLNKDGGRKQLEKVGVSSYRMAAWEVSLISRRERLRRRWLGAQEAMK